jgi:putative spermidine/putrescine transport system substrate-binding protein
MTYSSKRLISRRAALRGMLGGVALAPAVVRPGFAQANRNIVLATWGGDYAKLLTKHVSGPVLGPRGWTVINDEANVTQRKAKVVAERRLPVGTSDVQALTATDVAEMTAAGTLDKLDLSKIPNSKNIIKTFSIADSPYFSPHIYSGNVVVYNPKLIPSAPTGMDALWDPKNRGKVGIVDIQHVYTTMSAALVAGGKPGDFDKAKKALLDLKKLQPRFYPSNEALAQALMTEEIGLCVIWKARAVQWQNAGANILTIAPKEGLLAYVSGFTIPKNAPNKEGAYAFLEAALEPSVQEGFAVDMGYNPVVSNAKVEPGLRSRIGFTPEEEKLLVNPDLEFLAKRTGELKDFWDKEFKSGA